MQFPIVAKNAQRAKRDCGIKNAVAITLKQTNDRMHIESRAIVNNRLQVEVLRIQNDRRLKCFLATVKTVSAQGTFGKDNQTGPIFGCNLKAVANRFHIGRQITNLKIALYGSNLHVSGSRIMFHVFIGLEDSGSSLRNPEAKSVSEFDGM